MLTRILRKQLEKIKTYLVQLIARKYIYNACLVEVDQGTFEL